MSRLHGATVGATLWLIEIYDSSRRRWIVDDWTRAAGTAEKTVRSMRHAGTRCRFRRFLAEGETPRGRPPRRDRNGE
jgi:hypothetical protein